MNQVCHNTLTLLKNRKLNQLNVDLFLCGLRALYRKRSDSVEKLSLEITVALLSVRQERFLS